MPGPSFIDKALARVGTKLDQIRGWDRLPLPLALLTLIGLRDELRQANLYDSYEGSPPPAPTRPPAEYLTMRTIDGSYNDLSAPSMGMANTRFGRNVPLSRSQAEKPPELLDPNPRLVSRELLVRHEFKPATTLNILAGAWLQFQVRDWFSHGTDPDRVIEVPPAPGDPDQDPMAVPTTPADTSATGDEQARTFVNTETHWWDGSQIYGSTQQFQEAVRTGSEGKVCIGDDGLIDLDPALLGQSGGADGWWLGLELMTTVFMREHNAICDRLRAAYPSWSDDQLFDKARLVNSALMAKIHTVEWTPAILGHPALQIAMRANWFGLAGQRVHDLFGRINDDELVSGIPGSPTAHHAAPYAITEDFVAVYRMHPLIPDDYVFYDLERRREGASGVRRPARAELPRVPAAGPGRAGALLPGCRAPWRGHAAQPPALHASLRPHRRDSARPGRRGRAALTRARRSSLQRVPQAAADAPGEVLPRDQRRRPERPRNSCRMSTVATSRRSTSPSACTANGCPPASVSATRRSGSSS